MEAGDFGFQLIYSAPQHVLPNAVLQHTPRISCWFIQEEAWQGLERDKFARRGFSYWLLAAHPATCVFVGNKPPE